jgi:hypothetical protein
VALLDSAIEAEIRGHSIRYKGDLSTPIEAMIRAGLKNLKHLNHLKPRSPAAKNDDTAATVVLDPEVLTEVRKPPRTSAPHARSSSMSGWRFN